MQAGTCHHVSLRAKDVAHLFLNIDKFDKTELRVVGIKKQVDIAVWPRLLTGDRAEQIQASHRCPVQVGRMCSESRDNIVSIHRRLPERHDFV